MSLISVIFLDLWTLERRSIICVILINRPETVLEVMSVKSTCRQICKYAFCRVKVNEFWLAYVKSTRVDLPVVRSGYFVCIGLECLLCGASSTLCFDR